MSQADSISFGYPFGYPGEVITPSEALTVNFPSAIHNRFERFHCCFLCILDWTGLFGYFFLTFTSVTRYSRFAGTTFSFWVVLVSIDTSYFVAFIIYKGSM